MKLHTLMFCAAPVLMLAVQARAVSFVTGDSSVHFSSNDPAQGVFDTSADEIITADGITLTGHVLVDEVAYGVASGVPIFNWAGTLDSLPTAGDTFNYSYHFDVSQTPADGDPPLPNVHWILDITVDGVSAIQRSGDTTTGTIDGSDSLPTFDGFSGEWQVQLEVDWGFPGQGTLTFDIPPDTSIDMSFASQSPAVPEPASLSILALGGIALTIRRRK